MKKIALTIVLLAMLSACGAAAEPAAGRIHRLHLPRPHPQPALSAGK